MALTNAAVSVDRKDPRFDTLKKGHNLRFPATDRGGSQSHCAV